MNINQSCLGCCLFLFGIFVQAQQAEIQIIEPNGLNELMILKTDINRQNFENRAFTIQIFYGEFDKAQVQLKRFELLFPKIKAEISFETPNYKIRVGEYKIQLEAEKDLRRIKRAFPAAFVLKPKLLL